MSVELLMTYGAANVLCSMSCSMAESGQMLMQQVPSSSFSYAFAPMPKVLHTHACTHTHAHTHTAVTLLLVKFVEQFLCCLCGKSCVGV